MPINGIKCFTGILRWMNESAIICVFLDSCCLFKCLLRNDEFCIECEVLKNWQHLTDVRMLSIKTDHLNFEFRKEAVALIIFLVKAQWVMLHLEDWTKNDLWIISSDKMWTMKFRRSIDYIRLLKHQHRFSGFEAGDVEKKTFKTFVLIVQN